MTTPRLTDRAALLRNRARAKGPMFLHDLAREELQDRLAMVNRSFTAPAIVTGFPELWGELLPGARVVPDTPVLDLQQGAHDLVVHVMALHWADDPVGQLVQEGAYPWAAGSARPIASAMDAMDAMDGMDLVTSAK